MTFAALPHPAGITEPMIERLVRDFYARVRADDRLGPIFLDALGDDWEEHLHTMMDFWSSLMLTTGRYSGRPLQKHLALRPVVDPSDFEIWLRLFRQTAHEVAGAAGAAAFIDKAERVARSFRMAMFDELGLAARL